MKKILITGGAGFIGYHLAKHLLINTNCQLVLVDNLQRGQMDRDLRNLIADSRVDFIQADLTDWSFYQTLPADFAHIYHLAAVNGTQNFYDMPAEVLRINTLSLIYILEWIKNLQKKPKLCFTSSNEVYAGTLAAFNQLPLPTPENVPLVISDPYNPRWSYAGSKLIGELLLIHYSQTYHVPAIIVRPHNFYGPRAGFGHVIPGLCEKISQRLDPMPLPGADETRTFCYIIDAVKAMRMLMDSPATDKQPAATVHIGGTDEITMRELAKKMFAVAGWQPRQLAIQPSPRGSVRRRLADISKIKNLVGWQPEVSLEQGLKNTFAWYQQTSKNCG